MTERVLVDTGPIVALLDKRDDHHQRCRDAMAALTPPLLTCWLVIAEAAWLLRKHPDAIERLFEAFDAGLFGLLDLDADAIPAIGAVMKRYHSTGVQLADAALVHLAEQEHIRTVFTTDRRDFSIIRLKGNRSLRIIPDLQ